MSGKYFFNAPLQLPQGANIALENLSGNKIFLDSNSSMATSYNLVLPSADGTNGQALITDGSGNLRFGSVSGGEASSIASNAVTNSTSGDIVFTTDSGSTTLGTVDGNVVITTGDPSNYTHFVSNDGAFVFSTNGNIPQSLNDVSNLTLAISNMFIGTTAQLQVANATESINKETGCLILGGGLGVGSNVNIGGNVNISNNASLSQLLNVNGILTASANVDVSGNVNVTKSVDITANLVVDETSTLTGAVSIGSTLGVTGDTTLSSALGVTGDTTLSSALGVTGVSTFTGNAVVNGSLIQSVNEFSDSTESRTDLWNGSNSAPSKHILLDTSAASLYSSNAVAIGYTTGQTMNLFFTNNSGGTANANIDFGANKLYSGSGLAQYIVFNTSGQSATLIYINASSNNDGWRIINTGGTVH
jgi:hypothetical protein